MKYLIPKRFDEQTDLLAETKEHLAWRIEQAVNLIVEALRNDGAVYLFGNGGSAADAQHIAGELIGRFLKERPAFRAAALSVDTSVMTAVGNDYAYDQIFVRQLQGLGRKGDVAWALSTSGNSPNVVAALQYARQQGLATVAITGRGGGRCAEFADVLLDIPAESSPDIQNAGMVVYHILCELIESALA